MDGEEDRISSLPDCLLLKIISCLPTTKHAIKTSTLSKRWQHLWTFLPNLIFIESKDVCKRVDGYSSFIDKTLTQCPTDVHLNKFELTMSSDSSDFNSPQLNSWIRYAIARNVQEVDIELPCGTKLEDDFFLKNLCATKMKLRQCKFIHPIGVISWEKLKCLCISLAILDEDLIANILSGSPCLETLELDHCYGYSSINVTSKSVKNLVISNYDYSMFGENRDCLASIKIDAPYILSLTIRYQIILREILLLNMSSLVEAHLDYWSESGLEEEEEELLKGLLQSLLRHGKSVTIGYFTFKVLKRLDAKGFEISNGEDDSD